MEQKISSDNTEQREMFSKLHESYVENRQPSRLFYNGLYWLVVKDNDKLTFIQVTRPDAETTSFKR